jgi:hypothetical protein
VAFPVFVHESETWALITQQFKGMETSEINILRPLVRCALYNYPYNEDIELKHNIRNVVKTIGDYRMYWYEFI